MSDIIKKFNEMSDREIMDAKNMSGTTVSKNGRRI